MSYEIFNSAAAPSAPGASKVAVWFDSTDLKLEVRDNAGNITILGGLAIKDYRIIKVTNIFTGTVVYTPSAGCKALYVECIGGGGQGGGAATAVTNAAGGGGGGGGAYSALWYTGAMKSPFTVAVGAGGTGAAAGANGNAGGDTTFDSPSICTAKGGSGGLLDTVGIATIRFGGTGGAGGAAASGVGDIKSQGAPGGMGIVATATFVVSGRGGDGGGLVGGGAIEGKNATAAGNVGSVYGGGGSGATIISGGASQTGGVGGAGLLRITEYG